LAEEWNAWDATMLPEIRESYTEAFTADQLADHIGASRPSLDPDPAKDWPS
jgi:hypothetical protein